VGLDTDHGPHVPPTGQHEPLEIVVPEPEIVVSEPEDDPGPAGVVEAWPIV
jgi:hypothetical protein